MSIKREGLKKEIVEAYLKERGSVKETFCAHTETPPIKNIIKNRILNKDMIFKIQKEVVEVLESLYKSEDKVVSYVNGCRIVGYKIKSQKLIRVDIYNK
jgi:hypothetical protein